MLAEDWDASQGPVSALDVRANMRRKVAKVGRLRLSPNEEARLIREEQERRRRLRLQQVRGQFKRACYESSLDHCLSVYVHEWCTNLFPILTLSALDAGAGAGALHRIADPQGGAAAQRL